MSLILIHGRFTFSSSQMSFATTATTIVSGAIAERQHFNIFSPKYSFVCGIFTSCWFSDLTSTPTVSFLCSILSCEFTYTKILNSSLKNVISSDIVRLAFQYDWYDQYDQVCDTSWVALGAAWMALQDGSCRYCRYFLIHAGISSFILQVFPHLHCKYFHIVVVHVI